MSVAIDFMNNLSDNRKINKNYSIVKSGLIANLKEPCSIENPVFRLKKDDAILNSNYLYVRDFGKFYFINDIVFAQGGILEVSCHVDVIQTYGDQIRQLRTLVERQEFKYNPYIIDNELPVKKSRVRGYVKIGQIPRSNDNNIVLTVSGGAL